MAEPHVVQLICLKDCRVCWKPVLISTTQKKQNERIGRLLQMHADKREEFSEVRTGGIVAAVGLKMMTTGDTLCSRSHPVQSETPEFPNPSS